MKAVIPHINNDVTWSGMIDGACSTAAIASVATVAMPDIAFVPSRAANIPESFLANQANATVSAPAPTRGGGRGR